MNTYIIWREHRYGFKEVVGLFQGTYEKADELLEKLNRADPDVLETESGRYMYGYFRTEPTIITEQNVQEFLAF